MTMLQIEIDEPEARALTLAAQARGESLEAHVKAVLAESVARDVRLAALIDEALADDADADPADVAAVFAKHGVL